MRLFELKSYTNYSSSNFSPRSSAKFSELHSLSVSIALHSKAITALQFKHLFRRFVVTRENANTMRESRCIFHPQVCHACSKIPFRFRSKIHSFFFHEFRRCCLSKLVVHGCLHSVRTQLESCCPIELMIYVSPGLVVVVLITPRLRSS